MFLRLLCAAALVSAAATSVEKRCTASAPAHLTVSTSHNASGHWLSTLRLEREAPLPGRPGQLLLDVRPSATRCGNVRTDALVVTLQGSPPPPGPGYEEVPGIGYYRVHEEKVSWEEAKTACEAEDAYLLILNSEAEATAVQKLIQRYPNVKSWVHVGFNDKEKEGTYVTIFGELLSTTGFYRWQAGLSNGGNGGTGENCGYVDIPSMGLNDADCAYKASFVCEQFM